METHPAELKSFWLSCENLMAAGKEKLINGGTL